jgi:hypothetical protein
LNVTGLLLSGSCMTRQGGLLLLLLDRAEDCMAYSMMPLVSAMHLVNDWD